MKEYEQKIRTTRPQTKVWTCNWCKSDMVVDVSYLGTRAYHDECRAEAKVEQNRRKNAKRRGAPIRGRVFHRMIAERDEFVCYLCGDAVDMSLRRTSRYGATLDHVIPVAKGGDDSPENLRLAHWICNIKKSDSLEFVDA